MNGELKEIDEKIKELEKKKEEIKRNIRLSKLNDEIISIADVLHKKLCTHNHTDMCDWYYGDWSDEDLRYSRKEYYEKAKELRKYVKEYTEMENPDTIYSFIKEFLTIIKK